MRGRGSRAPRPPVIELVKADPPAPPAPAKRPSIVELVRPLLEEILVAGDRDWYRVALFHTVAAAGMNGWRLARAYSTNEWEWRHVRLAEVDQSAIYVRWTGKAGNLL